MAKVVDSPPLEAILDFCAAEPIERVFLEDIARRGLGRFVAAAPPGGRPPPPPAGAIRGPGGRGGGALARGGGPPRPRMIVGEERAVGELWEAIRRRLPTPLEDRPGQPVFELEAPPPPAGTGLRAATRDDLDLLVPACAAAYLEEVGVDACARDPDLFRWRTCSQIELGRSWLWVEEGRIRFKAEASAWTPLAVQLQQVWVDPEVRGRGYAKRALADLCGRLLSRTPAVCLFARSENVPALALYASVGMRRTLSYRSLIFA